jgi:hypothetical protein
VTLPALNDWEGTRIGLHQATQVAGAVRKALAAPEPNWTHLGMRVIPEGLTTGQLPGLGEIVVSFVERSLIHRLDGKNVLHIPLEGHHQISLADALAEGLAASGHSLTLDRAKITSDAPFQIDERAARDYAQALNAVAGTLQELRRTLPGQRTPVVVWPHGFDISFLWFATDEASEQAPHMSFGFSPGSQGLDRPYVYSYAYPIPEGLTDLPLPDPARWHASYWIGAIIDYDSLRDHPEPWEVVKRNLRTIFETVAGLLKPAGDLR